MGVPDALRGARAPWRPSGCGSASAALCAVARSGFFVEPGGHVVDDIALRRRQHVDVTDVRILRQLNRLVEGAELTMEVLREISRDRVVIQTLDEQDRRVTGRHAWVALGELGDQRVGESTTAAARPPSGP